MTSKRNKSNNNSRKASLTRINTIGGVSDRQRVKLKYTMVTALTSIVTTGAFDYVFRGNSVFDPDFSGTGGQPANYDDYSALYNQYRVWGSSIKVHLMTTISGNEPILWAIGPRHSSTSVTLPTQMDFAAQPYVQSRLHNIYRTGAPDTVFQSSMSTMKFQGLSASEFEGRDDLTSLVSTNPAEQWYWHVSATNIDVSITSDVAIHVELVYDVEFFDRIDTTLDFKERFARMNGIVSHLGLRSGRASGLHRPQLDHAPDAKDAKNGGPRPSTTPTIKKARPADDGEETDEGVIVPAAEVRVLKVRR